MCPNASLSPKQKKTTTNELDLWEERKTKEKSKQTKKEQTEKNECQLKLYKIYKTFHDKDGSKTKKNIYFLNE